MELKDREDREILIKARPIDIGPEKAEFWTDKDAIMSNPIVHGFRGANGKVTRKPKKILQVANDSYTNLFTLAQTNSKSQEALLKRLPSGNFVDCDRAVSTPEVSTVVSNWTAGRMPGLDGVPQIMNRLAGPFNNYIGEQDRFHGKKVPGGPRLVLAPGGRLNLS